jgi:DNA repair exonuclease SbcCD nuclease subunit
MALARFLQVSDVHLGAPFRWLPPERREERRRDQRAALERVVREAMERGAHAILVPGDLFDQEGVEAGTLAFALSVFDVRGCPPVFIAPGNHDPYSERSLYWNERLLQARAMRWPAHVHVFNTPYWTGESIPGLPGVRVWGRSFTPSMESVERPLAPATLKSVPSADPGGFHLGLFHGSLEGHCPPGQRMTAPFSEADVAGAPFTYLAVGHYHASTRLEGSGGPSAGVRLAYAGSAVALDATESGVHGALEVRVEYGRRLPFVEVESLGLDPRRAHVLTVEISHAATAEHIDRRVQKALDDAGATERDIVTVRLSGRLAKGVRLAGPGADLRTRAFHLGFDLRRLRPDYDLDTYRAKEPGTTEERFALALLERRDQESDPLQRALIESALYYGLDAFRLREVVPAYEELGE